LKIEYRISNVDFKGRYQNIPTNKKFVPLEKFGSFSVKALSIKERDQFASNYKP